MASVFDHGSKWFNVTENNVYACVFSEAVPGFMLGL